MHAVELDEPAYRWAQRNLTGTGVDLRLGDAFAAFDDLLGRSTWWSATRRTSRSRPGSRSPPRRATTTRTWRSSRAQDGLDAIRLLAVRAAALLKPGGVLGVEHADVQGEAVPGVLTATGGWTEVRDHRDLAGRPRFTTARLAR